MAVRLVGIEFTTANMQAVTAMMEVIRMVTANMRATCAIKFKGTAAIAPNLLCTAAGMGMAAEVDTAEAV